MPSLVGYGPGWTQPVQALGAVGIALVDVNGTVYSIGGELVGDPGVFTGLGKRLTITVEDGTPALSAEQVFTYTDYDTAISDGGVTNAIYAEGKVWFGLANPVANEYYLYSWDLVALSPTLEKTFSDADNSTGGGGRIVVGWTGTDLFVAYTTFTAFVGDGLRVRLRDGGAWTNTGFVSDATDPYVPVHAYAYGGDWYVTGWYETDALAWFLATSNSNIVERGEFVGYSSPSAYISNPLVPSFDTDNIYFVAEGFESVFDENPVLWKIALATGVQTQEHDFALMIYGGPIAEYGGSMYFMSSSGRLFKSDGGTTTSWSEVT